VAPTEKGEAQLYFFFIYFKGEDHFCPLMFLCFIVYCFLYTQTKYTNVQ